MTWKRPTEMDWREWKLLAIDPHDRQTWRSGVRSAMPAASQLQQASCMLHLYLHVNQKSDDDDDDDDDSSTGNSQTWCFTDHQMLKCRKTVDFVMMWD